ncbi:YaiI/YqxD family protein [Falsigemmobacter intermedius]|uniref:UPF0178 protein EP867_07695 n=1 Tax=Falsigemmobacter intermedius TaxID=1553448 RepID=A0A3S3YEQ3_9RHOB|nr:YaiI/YqxD family protein [Falsigemmobacter intermedius]RWY42254.1 YaiI/YqxD family protein [Falsigemmobacter intermedius]
MTIWVDADACPVRAEVEKVATRLQRPVIMVTNGGIRAPQNPLVTVRYVADGPDVADMAIAEGVVEGDVVVTNDIPLAAKVVEAGGLVIRPDGSTLDQRNIGEVLAMRDLMQDLRSADPFRQGGGRPFSAADRSRFLEALDRLARRRR